MNKPFRTLTILLLYLVTITSCRKDTENTGSDGSEFFVSATSLGTYPKEALQALAVAKGFGSYVSQIKYDVSFYKFVYRTTYKGKLTDASGLVVVPKNMATAPSLLSAQHGTMFLHSDAPSNFPATFSGFELLASAGFVTAIPDYLGFGVSKDIIHPYYDAQLAGTTVADMLKATKYYLKKENISVSSRLFLLGYSEGGYVTMAAQKEIETHPEHNLSLTAAVEGAGGYDLMGMLSAVTSTPTYAEPSFLAFVLQSYNTTYDWKRPYSDFFQEPYAGRVQTLLNGTKSQSEINSQLTTSTAALFNPTFLANVQNASAEPVLKQALQNNSFLNWYPKSPTRLYHGTADVTVFYQTSVTTYNRFKAAGATNVELISIPGGNHQTSINPMLGDALTWFQSLDK